MSSAVTTWSLGACFACPRCLLRSEWKKCPRCSGVTVDLSVESLQSTWSAWRGFAEGWALYSFRAVRALKVLRWGAALVTVGACLAPVFGPWLRNGRPPELLEALIGLVVGLVFAWPIYEFMALYLLLFAHVLRGLSFLTGLAAELSPVGTLKFSVLAKLTRALSRPLLPQLEVWPTNALDGASQRGVLTTPLRLEFVRDGWGFMERHDVHAATPMRVKWESGEETDVALTHGGVDFAQAMSVRSDGSMAPSWLESPGRAGVRFKREFPVGTRVVLTRARAGLDDARVHLALR